jgi:hypothetical protein
MGPRRAAGSRQESQPPALRVSSRGHSETRLGSHWPRPGVPLARNHNPGHLGELNVPLWHIWPDRSPRHELLASLAVCLRPVKCTHTRTIPPPISLAPPDERLDSVSRC